MPPFFFFSFAAIQRETEMVRKMEMARETERGADGDRLLLIRSLEIPLTHPTIVGPGRGAAANRNGVGHFGGRQRPYPHPPSFSGTPHPFGRPPGC
jgi:hypothetical protein